MRDFINVHEKNANADPALTSQVLDFLAACQSGDIRLIEEMVQEGFDINRASSAGVTPLMRMAKEGDAAVCATLLTLGALVNLRDKDGMPALLHAINCGHASACLVLLDGGADADAVSTMGRTAHEIAAWHRREDLSAMLQAHAARQAANAALQSIRASTPSA